jgi:hypothetical protein
MPTSMSPRKGGTYNLEGKHHRRRWCFSVQSFHFNPAGCATTATQVIILIRAAAHSKRYIGQQDY